MASGDKVFETTAKIVADEADGVTGTQTMRTKFQGVGDATTPARVGDIRYSLDPSELTVLLKSSPSPRETLFELGKQYTITITEV
jgi:hypothetical protein